MRSVIERDEVFCPENASLVMSMQCARQHVSMLMRRNRFVLRKSWDLTTIRSKSLLSRKIRYRTSSERRERVGCQGGTLQSIYEVSLGFSTTTEVSHRGSGTSCVRLFFYHFHHFHHSNNNFHHFHHNNTLEQWSTLSYAPLASDLFHSMHEIDEFNLGKPFLPFEQLWGCLPPESSNFLPRPYRELMTLESSPIADFYPDTFKIDMNGAHNPWEGVNLLPFIDEKRLRSAMKGLLEKCREEEQARNRHVPPIMCVHDLGQHETIVSAMSKEWGFGTLTECHSKFMEMKKETHIPTDGWNFKRNLILDVVPRGISPLLHMRLVSSNR